ncbi:MAG TPA: ABC transporter ATP-binding protein [Candidatus Limnocylindria bacterium]|nr:ABC transporter ATP-binding protein [Candidatus Limnocylindria bacterium]
MAESVASVSTGVTPSRNARSHVVVERVAKTFETRDASVEALREVSLEIQEHEFVTLIGPSGCGKSTLLRIIGGLIEPSTGRIALRGRSPQEAQRTKDIGFVFQQPALLPWRSVAANVELPFELNRGAGADRLCSTSEILALVGLGAFATAHPYQLSGGMQQRVAIARALIFDPALLLMDEPFGALDEITRAGMRYELLRIWGDTRKTVLFVTHSIPEAIVLSDRVVVMSPRPGEVREIIDITLPRPRTEEMESTPDFVRIADRLRHLLKA